MAFFTSHDGAHIFYRTLGQSSSVPIFLIHGFASTHTVNWINTNWTSALQDSYFVVMLDVRGHGESEKRFDKDFYTLQKMAHDIVALAAHLLLSKIFVMGYSMGAMLSLIACSRFQELFAGCIAGGIGKNLLIDANNNTKLVIDALLAPSSIDVPTTSIGYSYRAFAEKNKQNLKALAICFAQIRQPFPKEDMRKISCPILIAAGDQDTAAGSPEHLKHYMPHAQIYTILNKDHMSSVGDHLFKRNVQLFLNKYASQTLSKAFSNKNIP